MPKAATACVQIIVANCEFLFLEGMTNKHCAKLKKQSRLLNWKGNPVLRETDKPDTITYYKTQENNLDYKFKGIFIKPVYEGFINTDTSLNL